jgi:exopolysaccharide biosynthesis polyprenyl glycosylphosphotransferase
MNKIKQLGLYICFDFIASAGAWLAFNQFRKTFIEAAKHGYDIPVVFDAKLILTLLLIPTFWLIVYAASGFYQNIFRRSRLRDTQNTFLTSGFGVLVLFFSIFLDDSVANYSDYYYSLFGYFFLHFFVTLFFRVIISTGTIRKIQRREWGYESVLIGSGKNAHKLYHELQNAKKSEGFDLKGFLTEDENPEATLNGLPNLGHWKNIAAVIEDLNIKDVILCMDEEYHTRVMETVDVIQNQNVKLKIMPDSYGMVMGMVKMNNILGAMLVEVDFEVMPQWQKTIKRSFDLLSSTVALLLLSPLFLLLAIWVKLDSKGRVFFTQERIGFQGKPFQIIKFRSMRSDAETKGPQLSSEHDDRRTKAGIFLRKTRLDELPQFWNVLVGDMSIVGPRPERQFFIDQIVQKAPIYTRLHRIKPGITSWGQVKFGYASNVNEMVERMKYDILYLENMSLGLDVKICIYTALIMIQGRGK